MFARLRSFALGGLFGAALLAPLPAFAEAGQDPLPRFEDPLCPGVVGLEREAAEAMVGRIRENAEEIGLRMAENGACRANLIVAFVSDANAFLSEMQTGASYLFADLDLDKRRALLNDPGPAHVVLQVVPRSRDGRPIPRYRDQSEIPQTTMWMAHSKIYVATRIDIAYALVLLDREDIGGANIRQLADFATFRGLSRWLPDPAVTGQASILTLFDEGAARPDGLTEFDRAYLAQLYSGPPNLPAASKLADIERATGTNMLE